jgi:hypothetical protein
LRRRRVEDIPECLSGELLGEIYESHGSMLADFRLHSGVSGAMVSGLCIPVLP